jgi:Flp pilus assembly protein CpaB
MRRAIFFSFFQSLTLFLLASFFFSFQSNQLSEQSNFSILPVLNEALPLGRRIRTDQIRKKSFQCEELKNLFLTFSELQTSKLFARTDLNSHLPILKQSVQKNPRVSLASDIPAGLRLYSLSLHQDGKSDFVQIGDHVDVVAIIHFPQPVGGVMTETLLENIVVQGKGDSVRNKRWKTTRSHRNRLFFYLPPEQVKLMVYAETISKFRVFLKSNGEETQSSALSTSMTLNKFLANEKIQKALRSDVFQIY